MPRILFILAFSFITLSPFVALSDLDIIAKRQAGFKENGKSMKAISAILKENGDISSVAAAAQTIEAFSKTIPTLFPKGSDQGDTEAKPEIWTDMEKFKALAQEHEQAAKALVEAIDQKASQDVVKEKFETLGKSCGNCHKQFRKD